MLNVGDTETLAPIKFPGFQVYDNAPIAERFAELPAQMVNEDGFTAITGIAFTTKLTVAVVKQPVPFPPVTVYKVVIVGFITILAVFNPPGFQV